MVVTMNRAACSDLNDCLPRYRANFKNDIMKRRLIRLTHAEIDVNLSRTNFG